MPHSQDSCPNCGADLDVDEAEEAPLFGTTTVTKRWKACTNYPCDYHLFTESTEEKS